MDTPLEESNLAHIGSAEDIAAKKVCNEYNNRRIMTLKQSFCVTYTTTLPTCILFLLEIAQNRPLQKLKLIGLVQVPQKASKSGEWRINVTNMEIPSLESTLGLRSITANFIRETPTLYYKLQGAKTREHSSTIFSFGLDRSHHRMSTALQHIKPMNLTIFSTMHLFNIVRCSFMSQMPSSNAFQEA
mmetsp:Transcript_9673/g.10682  ORF Transcript_9673/g.10682 Transcript_9673/m.10682 type:complete len:187 (+) Transcript_9673:108-668(+)